jgi:hypothetical protein
LTLKNVSKEGPLWVSMRMLMGPPQGGDVWLDVVHARTGEKLEVTCDTSGGVRRKEHYVVLTGEALFSVVRPLPCMTFSSKGPWRITAHYKDDNSHPPQPPFATKWFSGELVSNTIEIEVVPEPRPR